MDLNEVLAAALEGSRKFETDREGGGGLDMYRDEFYCREYEMYLSFANYNALHEVCLTEWDKDDCAYRYYYATGTSFLSALMYLGAMIPEKLNDKIEHARNWKLREKKHG